MDLTDELTHSVANAPELTDDDWRREGLCAETDPEAFFPEKSESAVPARRICQLCPVQFECLLYAVDTDQRYGIWGGSNSVQRRVLRQHRRAARTAATKHLVRR